jgi:hypothetical protein
MATSRTKLSRLHTDPASTIGGKRPHQLTTLASFFCAAVLFSSLLPARAQEQLPHVPTIDDLFTEVGNCFPAFGGLYVDPDTDTLYVWVLPGGEEHLDQLDTAITQVFGDERPMQRHIEPLKATYSFRQLKEWYERMSPRVLAIPGAVFTDIDDRNNRLTVAVEQTELTSAVEVELAATSVPREAVDIIQEAPPMPEQTLQDFRRPVIGGIQIQRNVNPMSCTLGFVALRQGNTGIVTNSHCTNVQGGVEGTIFFQEDLSAAANRAAMEFVDPCYFPANGCPAPWLSGCPDGRRCRYSDSAFGLILTSSTRGEIARPVFNTINWNQQDIFNITEKGNLAVVGSSLQKVGRTTGWTEGNVTRACVKVNQMNGNITLLCQNQANYASMPGDSGSPVFGLRTQGPVWTVSLLGIHWGAVPNSVPPISFYSPIGGNSATFFGTTSGVQSPTELGPLTVCLNTGFTC